jgi:hypothetical protein
MGFRLFIGGLVGLLMGCDARLDDARPVRFEELVLVGLKTADRFPALRPFLLRAYHALRAGKRWLKATLAR